MVRCSLTRDRKAGYAPGRKEEVEHVGWKRGLELVRKEKTLADIGRRENLRV